MRNHKYIHKWYKPKDRRSIRLKRKSIKQGRKRGAMKLISKEVVKRIIDSGRTREQMLGMLECAVTYGLWKEDSSTEYVVKFGECDDCISRSEAIRIASGYCHWSRIPEELAKLPPVWPKERTGHWIAVYQGDEIINYRCSECEFGNTFGKNTDGMYYCPNCGAKMKE